MGNSKKKKNTNTNSSNKKNNTSTKGNAQIADSQAKQPEKPVPPELEKFRRFTADDYDKDKVEVKEKSATSDINLELKHMSRAERKQAKKERFQEITEGMGKGEKFRYLFDYYKWWVLVPLFSVILIVYTACVIYKNSSPVALGYAILNTDSDQVNKDFEKEYAKYLGISDRYQYVTSTDKEITYEYYEANSDYVQTSNITDYNILRSDCETGDYDIIISDAQGTLYCSHEDVSHSLKGYLDVNQYEILEPYMVEFKDGNDTERTFALDISKTEYAKNLNLSYEDVYLSFSSVNDEGKQRALKFIEYILDVDLGIDEQTE